MEVLKMRKMVAGLFLSLDGVIEAPETWTGPYMNDDMGQAIGAQFAGSDAMVLGRRTYDAFAAAFAGRSDPMAQQMNPDPKFVVTPALNSARWGNCALIQ